jgi:indole-3-glycerol phosphate synthase
MRWAPELRESSLVSERRFSHAIAEGDGISVIAAVEDAQAAQAAEAQRAEALVVARDPAVLREATGLPILWRAEADLEQAALVADAVILALSDEEGQEIREQQRHQQALDLGLDCVVEVRTEEELVRALEILEPEIFLLVPPSDGREERLDAVLELLAEVPAGKLAIADLAVTTEDEVQELERAGVDAVIVHAEDVSPLVGDAPPEV